MSRTTIVPVDRERPFEAHELFFSTTNARGIIQAGNSVFTRVSGYDASVLVGAPHSKIRHPDMPRAVFRLLWNYLEAGKPIAAYVKNMAADGSYYWVVATAVPMTGGYLSVRFKPASPLFAVVRDAYAEIRRIELHHEFVDGPAGREPGIVASTERLLQILNAKGFANYDDFMTAMLTTESRAAADGRQRGSAHVSSRSTGDLQHILQACQRIGRFLDGVFMQLDAFARLDDMLRTQSGLVLDLAQHISLTSRNAVAAAHQLQSEGATLTVIARTMGDHATESAHTIRDLRGEIERTGQSLKDVSVRTCIARTQTEMAIAFADELARVDTQQSAVGDVGLSLQALAECLDTGTTHAVTALADLAVRLGRLADRIEGMQDALRALEMVQVAARIESARIGRGVVFGSLFADVGKRIAAARAEVTSFVRAINETRAGVLASASEDTEVHNQLAHLAKTAARMSASRGSAAGRVA